MHTEDITDDGLRITEKQFKAYEKIRGPGGYNMRSPEAVEASGLTSKTYFAIVENYEFLEMKFFKWT